MNKIHFLQQQLLDEKYTYCEESFEYFFKQAWNVFDPEPFLDNWHIGCICEHMQAQAEGEPELRNMIINIQPRLTKSKTISVAFPAWRWLKVPIEKFICVSHSDRLVKDLTTNSRDLIQSPWYSERWIGKDKVFELKKDSNTVSRFDNTKGGYRIATTPGGLGLGVGYSHLLMDDPNDLMDIYSEPALQKPINFYRGVLRNRINNSKTGKKTLVQQRLSEKDLTQWLQDNEGDKWFVLVIPSEYTKHWTFVSPIGINDPRTQEGELVCPDRFDEEYYEEEKKHPYTWAALYQQRPKPIEGSIIKHNWLQFYNEAPIEQINDLIISVDLAIENKDSNDFCVFTVWGNRGAKFFLLDMVRERLDFPEQLAMMLHLSAKYPKARTKLIEKKATGSPLMKMLENKVSGLLPVNPVGHKIERLFACVPEFIAGNVMLPNPERATWVNDVIEELTSFPKGKNDDIVDSVTMALNYMSIQNAKTEAYLFAETKDSIKNRLTDFNSGSGYKYDSAVVTNSRGYVKKIFTW